MAEIIKMPLMSDSMTEGRIAAWHKKVGDEIKSGDLLAEIETDKATMEFESFVKGTLLHIGIQEDETAPVGALLAIIGKQGDDVDALIKSAEGSASEEAPAKPAEGTPATEAPTAAPATASTSNTQDSRVKASPLAKKIAADKGIDLSSVVGSGDNGRIVKRDLDSATSATPTPQVSVPQVAEPLTNNYEDVKLSQMRKTIAKRLSESKFTAPHFYLTIEINMDKAIAARKQINGMADTKISFNDMVIKAAAISLKQHPAVNSSWLGDAIRIHHDVHIGMAVAIDDGLIVPVIRNADKKGLAAISKDAKDLGGRAKDKKLQPEEFSGNTFTISNLGMFGIEEFTAIVNPPDACILAVGGIKETAGVVDGNIQVVNVMKVTLSCDHRVVDGAVGSQFLQTFKGLLEEPMRMML